MTTIAAVALQKIRALRRYVLPQSAIAEQRILKSLNIPDFTAVVQALETPLPEVPKQIQEIRSYKTAKGVIHEHHHTDPEQHPTEKYKVGGR